MSVVVDNVIFKLKNVFFLEFEDSNYVKKCDGNFSCYYDFM